MTRPEQVQRRTESSQAITIRPATAADTVALERLAQLDSAPSLTGSVLIAECGADALAAIEIDSGTAVADPFRRTAGITSILTLRRQALVGVQGRKRWRRFRIRHHRHAERAGLAAADVV